MQYSSGRWLTPSRQGMKSIATWSNACHEKRIMIGSGSPSSCMFCPRVFCGLLHGGEDCGVAGRWRIRVDHLCFDGDSPTLLNLGVEAAFSAFRLRWSRRSASISRILGFQVSREMECCFDCARKYFANADRPHSIDGSCGFGGHFKGQHEFCGGSQRVSCASGSRFPPAWPLLPSMRMRMLAGAAMWVTRPRSRPSCSRMGPCSM